MGRLTEKDASGRCQVKEIPWEKVRAGETITAETAQTLYGCLCKLKAYEDTGMGPDQLEYWKMELEAALTYVCDTLCRYPREITVQEVLDEICEKCPVSACIGRIFSGTEEKRQES